VFVVASSSNSQILTVMQNGNVGIGSSSPAATLGINGTLLVTGSTTIANLGTGNVRSVNGSLAIGPVSLTADVSGILGAGNGGTGNALNTQYTVLLGNGTNPIATTTVGSNGQLFLGQTGAAPAFQSMSGDATISQSGVLGLKVANANVGSFGSTTQIPSFTVDAQGRITAASGNTPSLPASDITSGIFGVANGGTGNALNTQYDLLVGNGANPVATVSPGTVYQVLSSNGASANPSFNNISTLLTQGTGISITSTSTIGINTNVIMNIATGTLGNIFNISTSTNSLTLNLPFASIVNTGQLQATDFLNFNNKLSGSGTTNYLLKYTGPSTTASSLLYDTGTYLALNSTSPTALLTVQGSSTLATTPIFTVASSSNSQLLTVLANGKVGIGTTSPTALLSLGNGTGAAGTTAALGINFGDATANLYRSSAGRLTSDGGIIAYFFQATNQFFGSNFGNYGSLSADTSITGTAGYNLNFKIGNVTKAIIDQNGNVGIGTTTPGSKLDLWGNLNVATSSTPSLFVNTATGMVGVGTSTPGFNLTVQGTSLHTGTSVFNGNVGIGTTTPSYKFVVAGTIQQASSTNCSLGIVTDANGVFNGCVASSRTLKRNIKDYVYNSSIIDQLQPVTYYWKDPNRGSGEKIGFIADDVKKVLPQAAVSGGDNLLAVDPNGILAVVVSELQNVRQSIIALFNRVGDLASKLQIDENKIAAQQNQINNLQKQVNLLLQIEAKGK
jgi:hypothetical protein